MQSNHNQENGESDLFSERFFHQSDKYLATILGTTSAITSLYCLAYEVLQNQAYASTGHESANNNTYVIMAIPILAGLGAFFMNSARKHKAAAEALTERINKSDQ